MCEEYNGWSNRETWATALWIDNERGLYEMVQETARNIRSSHTDEETDRTSNLLAEHLEGIFDEAFSDIDEMSQAGLNMLKDIGSLYRVNWLEIAKTVIEENILADGYAVHIGQVNA